MSDRTFQRVVKVIRGLPGKAGVEVKPSMSLKEDLDIDSQDMVELVLGLEEEFGIRVKDEEVEKVTTVQGILDYLRKQGAVWASR